ncbi:unnamed protein product [Musa acuminata subsp. malaccensis]|uniref:(wild Malaysian banana) hypothetical protein n=1 Tax=Musa acuminata subsp. malaccensis TaxID=214687 RepID=A0A804I9X9_MUSAM|nr:PREDICTED: uncharacterized protein LOC103977707 [Musa acuminata subsp. malaccensis]CAG1849578.1 unnamed protein product [Musa acuminata subsp. malaccensis]
MSKKMATTATPVDGSGGGRQLRSHRNPLPRSPRFRSQTSHETVVLALPTSLRSSKKTKQQKKRPKTAPSEKEQTPTCGRNRRLPSASPDAAPQSRRRSPRFAASAAKCESDMGSSGGGGKEIVPASRNVRPSKPVGAPQIPRRSPRLASIAAVHAKQDGVLDLGGGGNPVEGAEKEGGGNKRTKVEVRAEEGKEVAVRALEHCCGPEEWTEEQEMALRKAYLSARPSPHFWKKVSKMVPGKSAQECFNRIHTEIATPPQHQPRSRAIKSNWSPIGNVTFSDKSVDNMKLKVKRARSGKQKSLVAQKTVRHLLRQHCLADQTKEADYFSVLETSPSALALDLPEITSPGTPDRMFTNAGFLLKCSENSTSAAHKRLLSRFKTSNADPSPEVLKQIKNVALHEKYIDHLHCREARRRAHPRTANSVAAGMYNKAGNDPEPGVLKAARAALIAEAKEAITHYQFVQSNFVDHEDDGATSDNLDGNSDNDVV